MPQMFSIVVGPQHYYDV